MSVQYSRVPNISAALLLDFGEIFLHFTIIRKYITLNKKTVYGAKKSYEIDSQKKGNIDISCQENGLLLTDTFSPMLCKGQEKQLRLLLLCVCGIDCNSKKVMPYCCNRFITPCNTYICVS